MFDKMIKKYKCVIIDAQVESSGTVPYVYLKCYIPEKSKEMVFQYNPQSFKFPAGSDIYEEMKKLAEGFNINSGKSIILEDHVNEENPKELEDNNKNFNYDNFIYTD